MIRLALSLFVLAALQDTGGFEYKAVRGKKLEVDLKNSLQIDIEGDEETVDLFKSFSPFFAFESFTYEGPGDREVLRAPRRAAYALRDRFDRAKVTGVYDEEDFEYEFDQAEEEQIDPDDKLKGMMYFIFKAGRNYRLTKEGVYAESDPNQDPGGEAMGLIANPFPRFGHEEVEEGASWETEWESRTEDKDQGGRIRFRQTCTLESLDGSRATIRIELEGADDRDGKDKDGNVNAVKVKGESKVVFDVEEGMVVEFESSGEVRTTLEGEAADAGLFWDGAIVFNIESRMKPRGEGEEEPEEEGMED